MHVVVHGGAGSPPAEPADRQRALRDAADSATTSSDPLAAACTAVRQLERDPRFNAGIGSAVQSDGRIRTDAGLMSDDGTVGGACGMTGVANAVDVARIVATETPHVLLTGEPAVALAADCGVETDEDLWTERTRERWESVEKPEGGPAVSLSWVRDHFGAGSDTVGAVATDGQQVVAATSTGGRWFGLAGRVGDVPQIGAGFYADERGAASTTGAGEAIARFGLARRAVAELGRWCPRQAADRVIDEFGETMGERAGVIVLDHEGHVGRAANTDTMQTARSEASDTASEGENSR